MQSPAAIAISMRNCTYKGGGKIAAVPNIGKDIRDLTLDDLKGFDAVFHLAALSNDPLSDLNVEVTYAINFRGSLHLAQLAKKAGVKQFLLASSCSNYGRAGDEMIDESAPLRPVTAYGRSKVWAEHGISSLAATAFAQPTCVQRPPTASPPVCALTSS